MTTFAPPPLSSGLRQTELTVTSWSETLRIPKGTLLIFVPIFQTIRQSMLRTYKEICGGGLDQISRGLDQKRGQARRRAPTPNHRETFKAGKGGRRGTIRRVGALGRPSNSTTS